MIIDSREKGRIVKDLVEYCNAEVKALYAGDYYLETEPDGIVIERMTYSDFSGKVISGRLWKQIAKCQEQSSQVYMILENQYSMKYGGIKQAQYVGILVKMAGMGLHVLHSRNMGETREIIKKMYDRYESGKKSEYSMTRVKPKRMKPREMAEFMLMGVEGVGKKTAQKCLTDKTLLEYLEGLGDRALSGTEERIWKCINSG